MAKLTPTARATMGAVTVYLSPRMALDQKIPALVPLFGDIGAKNFVDKIPTMAHRITRAVRGRLAEDADIEDLTELLDALSDSGAMEGADTEESDPNFAASPSEHLEGMDDDLGLMERIMGRLKDDVPPETLAKITEMIGEERRAHEQETHDADMDDAYDAACAELGRDEAPEETEKREEAFGAKFAKDRMGRDETPEEAKERRAADKMSRDRRMSRDSKRANDAKGRLGRDETPEELAERRKADRAEDRKRLGRDEPPPFKGRPNPGGTMDNMVTKDEAKALAKQAADEAIAGQRDIADAKDFCRPWIGSLSMAFDSAEGVYRHTLTARGVDNKEIHASALKTVLGMTPKPSASGNPRTADLALDAKPAKSFAERFPSAGRIGAA